LTDPEIVKKYINNIKVNDELDTIIFVPKYNFFSHFIPSFNYNLYIHKYSISYFINRISILSKYVVDDHNVDISDIMNKTKYTKRLKKTKRPLKIADSYK